jgi:thiol-disulfide isomerase/thioredoxin
MSIALARRLRARPALLVAALVSAWAARARPLDAQDPTPAGPAAPRLIVVTPAPGGGVTTSDATETPVDAGALTTRPAVPVRSVAAAAAAALVRQERGHPTAVVFYGPACPRSQAMLPLLLKLAAQGRASGATVLAFAVNGDRADLDAFLASARLTHDPLRIADREHAALGRQMAPLGVRIPQRAYSLPLVAVLDEGGTVLGQWEADSPPAMRAAFETAAAAFGVTP